MDRPRANAATAADRSGVQLFLVKPSPTPPAPPAQPLSRVEPRGLSRALWILDGLLVLTALSILWIPILDRVAALVLGSWLISMASALGVLATLGRR
ncbi:MAG: hypothetical protein J0M24_04680 [Verrucomicrobia bacterium]|nr:hypothetical protein [Verrucomicrobiota bacterium]